DIDAPLRICAMVRREPRAARASSAPLGTTRGTAPVASFGGLQAQAVRGAFLRFPRSSSLSEVPWRAFAHIDVREKGVALRATPVAAREEQSPAIRTRLEPLER